MIAKPCPQILEKNNFKWSKEAEHAFEQLKEEMENLPTLAILNFELPFVIDTDASEYEIGAVLCYKTIGFH